MKWPVAAVGFLATALGATPDEGHKYIRRLRAITVKHMDDLLAAQVTRRREADDSGVMDDRQHQLHDVRRFTPRMPTWAAAFPRHTCSESVTSFSGGDARRLPRTPDNQKPSSGFQPRPEVRTVLVKRRVG